MSKPLTVLAGLLCCVAQGAHSKGFERQVLQISQEVSAAAQQTRQALAASQARAAPILAAPLESILDQNEDELTREFLRELKRGNAEEIKKILGKGANVNYKDPGGFSALMLATYRGHAEVGELLLASGAYVNSRNDEGNSALIFAAYDGRENIVRMLIRAGAKVNLPNVLENTALIYAAPHPKIVELLLNHGATVNLEKNAVRSALNEAARMGITESVRLLLSHHANPDFQAYGKGPTALMWAAMYGNKKIVQLLLDANANVSLTDFAGMTAIDHALTDEILEMLLKHKKRSRIVQPPLNLRLSL